MEGKMKKAKEIMTKNPACCSPETSLQEIAKSMLEANCGEIPVLNEEKKPVGVITDRDITCRAVAQGKNPLELKAKDCMTKSIVMVREDTSLQECCAIMEEYQIRRVPVVDAQGRCCGIVAQADIALKASKEKAAEVLKQVSKSETAGSSGRQERPPREEF
jgi:CBS domain-containing protein